MTLDQSIQDAITNRIAQQLLNTGKTMLGDALPDFMKTPLWQKIELLLLALTVKQTINLFNHDIELVQSAKTVCNTVTTYQTTELVNSLVDYVLPSMTAEQIANSVLEIMQEKQAISQETT